MVPLRRAAGKGVKRDHCKILVGEIAKKFYLCVMVKRKEKIEDPLKLLLPGAIYDYFELVHTEIEVNLYISIFVVVSG